MQDHPSRFECPSAPLELRHLVQKASNRLWIALVLAATFHLSFTQWPSFTKERKVVKPLTTQFIKREPRLTKPLELKKQPRPKRRPLERRMISVKAKMDWQGIGAARMYSGVIQQLARPRINVHRAIGFESRSLEPAALATAIESEKDAADRVAMSLEMLDVEALDTGKYQAMVVQDPNDRRGIKGFFHFYRAYPASSIQNPDNRNTYQAYQNEAIRGLGNLVDALNRYTDIRSDVKGSINFDSRELFKTPWIYHLGVSNFKLTPSEAVNLGKYMQVGGLFFADTIYYGADPRGDHSNRDMIRDALGSVGIKYERDWEFTRLSDDHVIYRCFFDFDSLPAGGHEPFRKPGTVYTKAPWIDFLEGVMVDGRIVAIVCKKWYAKAWGEWGPGTSWPNQDNRRQLQFGVNIVVFALTQEGSITNQVMDAVQ